MILRIRTRFVLLSILIILLLVFGYFSRSWHNGNNTKPVVRIGYQEISLFRHLFIAHAKGYFDEEGVQVEIKPFVSANRLIEGVVSGELEGTGLTNLQVALTIQTKDPGRIKLANMMVWGERSYPDYIITRTDADIKDIKQLEGRTIGLHPGSAVKAFSRIVFQHFNVNIEKCHFLELEPTMMQSAILAGRVDALYCMDPIATNLVENGQCRVLLPNPMMYIFAPPVPISGTIFSASFLTERPEDAKRVIRALDKAIYYMREPKHEEEIAGYIAQYTPIGRQVALRLNPAEYWTVPEIDRERVQALANQFYDLRIIEKTVDINDLLISEKFFPL